MLLVFNVGTASGAVFDREFQEKNPEFKPRTTLTTRTVPKMRELQEIREIGDKQQNGHFNHGWTLTHTDPIS
jgi:hypothetical protein